MHFGNGANSGVVPNAPAVATPNGLNFAQRASMRLNRRVVDRIDDITPASEGAGFVTMPYSVWHCRIG